MIYVTAHAVQRYWERVRPTVDLAQAKCELEALVAVAGEPTNDRPDWFHTPDGDERQTEFLPLSDGIAGLVEDGALLTIAIRGSSSPEYRRVKKEARKRKRAARRSKPLFYSHKGTGSQVEYKERWR